MHRMQSERLTYTSLAPTALKDFHALIRDDHVRRYLLDGGLFDQTWAQERIRDSQDLFERRGVGLWLASATSSGEIVGFCGFLEMPSVCAEPQLVYALYERFTGTGYATEMARASMAYARRSARFPDIVASVDEANTASVRVLQKLGFQQVSTQIGSFGNVLVMRHAGQISDVR